MSYIKHLFFFVTLSLSTFAAVKDFSGNARYDLNSGVRKCSFPDGLFTDTVFVGPSYYNGAQSCGACLEITNPETKQTVVANVVDQCAGCGASDLVLPLASFKKIGDPDKGVIKVTWKQVRCPNVQGNIKYSWQAGSNQWWAAVQLQNHAVGVKSLEFKSNVKDWTPATRRDDNYFILSSAGTTGPFQFRIVSYEDKVVIDPSVTMLGNGGVATSTVQF